MLDTLKTSMTTKVKSMLNKFLEGLKLTTAPLKVGDPANKVTDATSDKGEATSEKALPTSGKSGTGIFAHVEPPLVYGGPLPSTHLNHVNTNLWRIIEEGFYPHDRSNFTPREVVDHQFNENALFIIQEAIPPEDLPHLRPYTVAKDAWLQVVSLYKGAQAFNAPTMKWCKLKPMSLQ